jgi:prefoldin subunit 5
MDDMMIGVVIQFFALLGGGVTAWTRINNDVQILKSRIIHLEKNETETSKKLDTLIEAIQELKILLAKKGI